MGGSKSNISSCFEMFRILRHFQDSCCTSQCCLLTKSSGEKMLLGKRERVCHYRSQWRLGMLLWSSAGTSGCTWMLPREACTGRWCWRTTVTCSPWVRKAASAPTPAYVWAPSSPVTEDPLSTQNVCPGVSVINTSCSNLTWIIGEFSSQVKQLFFGWEVNIHCAAWAFCFLGCPRNLSIKLVS